MSGEASAIMSKRTNSAATPERRTTLPKEKPVDTNEKNYDPKQSKDYYRGPSALAQTLTSTAHLANLLPTGTLLLFQVLCPLVSNGGSCDHVRRCMTAIVLAGCGLSGFLASFTDSFKGSDGKVYYGVATPKGFWTFEYVSPGAGPPETARYKLRAADFVHAFLSLMVFAAVALYDKNVVGCFYPAPQEETKEVLDVLPVAIGLVCSLLFLLFPTTRHGIGYPVSN